MIYPLGWFIDNQAITSLIIAIVFDIATGLIAAFVFKKISSVVSFQGMVTKASLLLMVALAALLQPYSPIPGLAVTTASFFFITEIISIAENLARLGVPMPERLRSVLVIMKTTAGIPAITTTTTSTAATTTTSKGITTTTTDATTVASTTPAIAGPLENKPKINDDITGG